MKELTKAQYSDCRKTFEELGEEALFLSHYQLAQVTDIQDPQQWKMFLMDPKTLDYISTEMNIIRSAALNDMVHKAPNSTSVGQSQLIGALTKLSENDTEKKGPVFIYTYVPPNPQQEKAPNCRVIDNSLINKTEDGWTISTE